MVTNGKQIKAARALLGWPQSRLADAASLHVNSVKYWESRGQGGRSEVGLKSIRAALEGAGVQFVRGGVVMQAVAA